MSTAPYQLTLPDQASDADLLAQVKRALRDAAQSSALVITGSFLGEVTDIKAHRDLILLLLDAPIPVFALPSSSIGQRGLPLLLAADRIVVGPETSTAGDWRQSPGLAPLLHHKLGPTLANMVLFGTSGDLLERCVDHGLAIRTSDPNAYLQGIATALANGIGQRLKRSLKAASELPLKEAIGFDLWFAHSQPESAP